jgi:serine/threonine protein phosphatase 1
VYAIGDIHGRRDLLEQLLDAIAADRTNWPGKTQLIFLGDYVDRGSQSREVIDTLLALPRSFTPTFLRGNHDQCALDFLRQPSCLREWLDLGGAETLRSYGIRPPRQFDSEALVSLRNAFAAALPPEHLSFLTGLLPSVILGDYLFVHAGIRPGVSLDRQSPRDMLWIRDEFLRSAADYGKIIVHGHSPHPSPVKRHNRIGIDTGAYLTGKLTALILEGEKHRFLSSSG